MIKPEPDYTVWVVLKQDPFPDIAIGKFCHKERAQRWLRDRAKYKLNYVILEGEAARAYERSRPMPEATEDTLPDYVRRRSAGAGRGGSRDTLDGR